MDYLLQSLLRHYRAEGSCDVSLMHRIIRCFEAGGVLPLESFTDEDLQKAKEGIIQEQQRRTVRFHYGTEQYWLDRQHTVQRSTL